MPESTKSLTVMQLAAKGIDFASECFRQQNPAYREMIAHNNTLTQLAIAEALNRIATALERKA